MLKNRLFIFLIFTLISTCLLVFSGPCLQGAKYGLNLSYTVVIPSLFPFTVCSLIISESGILEKINNNFYYKKTNFPIIETFVFVFSLIGGFPIGAKLINNNYIKGNITKDKAETMLAYCVNSGPAFIIIAVGSGILSDKRLGIVLFSANLLSAITLYLFFLLFQKNKFCKTRSKINNKPFSDLFVNSTYEATKAMGLICAFVVLFSTIIEVINAFLKPTLIKKILISLLEITNGVTMLENIYLIAFILGFSGFCVHFQVLSMCGVLKPNYMKFFTYRILHGILNVTYTYTIVKLFKISITVLAKSKDFSPMFSQHSIVFGIVLILLSVAFICSVNTQNNI